ncbi:MAG: hypothetical protein J7K33_07670 [Candidatus Marinimicrobia bacterium]|nr:hypothetical protein [Candidatus Neomarinimicrobiota bacterium]
MNTIHLRADAIKYGRQKKKKRRTDEIYLRRAKFLLASRPHLNTESLIATLSDEEVLATAFWELRFLDNAWEKIFALWFNSTFGFLLYLQHSENSMGQIFKCKKGHIQQMRVVDPSKIDFKKAIAL